MKGCDHIVKKKNKNMDKMENSEEKHLHTTEETLVSELPDSDANSNKYPKHNFFIVGIGASAGGLVAFEAFFSALPTNSYLGMAFVVVQHLDPNHKSILTDLIGRYTQLPVYEVTDGLIVQPDRIYVIPPSYDMIFEDGMLFLKKPIEMHGFRLPIDSFFKSLAQDQTDKALGIILSGTGSDGTLGMRAIKAGGGMMIVQSPESSEYDGMPRSAIATGLADYILPPAKMPAQLIAYANKAFGKRIIIVPKNEDVMTKIFNLLNTNLGHDFSNYKESTVKRRIERRMVVKNFTNVAEYVQYLEQNPAEMEVLFHEFLIGITSFFREPTAFETLQDKIFPHLFTGKNSDSVIRIWVPGCSTGEEAYSIAILFQEQMDTLKQIFKVQIFATDIDSRAIEVARNGVYSSNIFADVPSEILARFFTKESENNYRIKKTIREMIIFSEQDIIKDPPFSKLDLLSCRNVMIYLNKELQKKLIPLFYYALKPGGFLFLGSSETVGDFENLFEVVDRKSKLYRKKNASNELLPVGTFIPLQLQSRGISKLPIEVPIENKFKFRELIEQTMLQYNTPVGVLVNQYGDIFYLHGRTGMYLELASGEVDLNILKMAREGLKSELITDLHEAVVHKEPVFHPGLRVKTNGDFTTVNMVVRPVAADPDAAAGPKLFLVTFEEMTEWERNQKGNIISIGAGEGTFDSAITNGANILELKRKLQIKEESLKASNEELETSNEELKSSNEEMQSINEELQSTNEELETSKEELQSVNEELATVNTELQNKIVDLSQAINDMNNLLAGTGIGTIFVDFQLRILRFTPQAAKLVNLIQTDIGRPLGHIVSNFVGYDHLIEDVNDVLVNLMPRETEAQTQNGSCYLLRIRPYRTLENVIMGAVITFTNITKIKLADEIMKNFESMHRLAIVVHDSSDAITLQNLEGHITAWNPMAERIYGWSEAEALTMNISSLIPESQKEEELATLNKLIRAESWNLTAPSGLPKTAGSWKCG